MKLKNVLIVVKDIERSRQFYHDLFGLELLLDNDGNMILTEGLVLQDIRLRYNENQDSPLILTLRDLERLGKVESITSYELKMRVKSK